jgi:midasin
MKRLFCLVNSAISKNEPVLLVGETGCGKTSICQALAEHYIKPLRILNCHQHTETSDFIGSLRPVRNKSLLISSLLTDLNPYIPNISSYSLEDIFSKLQNLELPLDILALLSQKLKKAMTLFEWVDGPLVQAFVQGEYFLVDEISLADDSVLERLNSVLESERKLLIPEKAVEVTEDTGESGSEKSGGKVQVSGSEEMEAHEGFQIFATMNPGGDYGKKELSPALRNRFTEIWVAISIEDMREIVSKKTENHKVLTS